MLVEGAVLKLPSLLIPTICTLSRWLLPRMASQSGSAHADGSWDVLPSLEKSNAWLLLQLSQHRPLPACGAAGHFLPSTRQGTWAEHQKRTIKQAKKVTIFHI